MRATTARRLGARVALAVPVALVALLAAQVVAVVNDEYLPAPDYRVDAVVGRSASGPPLRLAVLGDSTVAGIGAPRAAASLAVLVADRVADVLGRPVAVTGAGVSGARTADVLESQVPGLLGRDVDVVLVVIGSNDVTHVTPPWAVAASTRDLLRRAAAVSGAPVVLGGIPEFATVPALPQPLRAVTGAYADVLRRVQRRAAADVGAPFVDIAAEASPRFVGRPETMSVDGFHPSAIGYGLWADALAPAVVAAVRADRPTPGGSGSTAEGAPSGGRGGH